MVRTKAEGVGGLPSRRRKKNVGFFIINCQSFAKIKDSLSLHKGQKPTVAI